MTMGCSTTMMIAVTSMAVALQRGLRVQRKTPRGCAPRMGKALDHFYQGLPRPLGPQGCLISLRRTQTDKPHGCPAFLRYLRRFVVSQSALACFRHGARRQPDARAALAQEGSNRNELTNGELKRGSSA
jgi:hypothetical protein